MDIETLRAFFMWCTIINLGLFVLSFVMCAAARDLIFRVHGKWFPMPRETFNVVIYSFFGLYKILIWVFVLVPYLALVIVG